MSKNRKSQLNELYKDPLPVTVFPLPPITPHNPISVLYCLYAYFFPNRPNIRKLVGILSPETRSVWITDETTAHDLWFCGFFGKGTLSRSEPSWYIRTQRLLGIIGQNENLTSEEITARRRATRFVFKAERARQERDILDKTLREEGKLSDFNTDVEPKTETDTDVRTWEQQEDQDEVIEAQPEPLADRIPNLEHLQLTLSEAIFLGVALKVLTVLNGQTSDAIPAEKLLSYCIQSYKVGQISDSPVSTLVPSACPLLIDYVVYHHYRSLGWVVKPGVKFGVDYRKLFVHLADALTLKYCTKGVQCFLMQSLLSS